MVKGICSGPHYAALMVIDINGQLLDVVILRDLDSTPPRYPFVVGDPPDREGSSLQLYPRVC